MKKQAPKKLGLSQKLNVIIKKITRPFDLAVDYLLHRFNKYHFWVMIALISAVTLMIRISIIPTISGDSYWFLEPWVKFIRDNGGLASLDKIPISYYNLPQGNIPYGDPRLVNLSLEGVSFTSANYPVFYYFLLASFSYLPVEPLFVIKIISYIFDFVFAFGLLMTLRLFTKNNVLLVIGYLFALILPTFIINSGLWGQTDAVYGGLAIWFIYFIIKNKPITAMLFIGLALAIKLQIVFILPIVGWLFLKRKYRLIYLVIPFVVVFFTFIPSYIAGMDFMTPINQYKNLGSTYSSVNLNSGSIYALFDNINSRLSPYVDNFGVPLAFLVLISLIYYVYQSKLEVDKESILTMATIFAFLTPYLLPHMHERYFYMAEAFILLYALTHKNKWHLVILSQFSGLMTYSNFILGGWFFPSLQKGNLVIASLINLIIIVLLIKDLTVLIHPKKDSIKTSKDFS